MNRYIISILAILALVSCQPQIEHRITSARFSVGAGRYVQFSPGFLCYDTLAHEYHFAKSQLQASHRGVYDGHWVDEFVWGHGEDPLFDSDDPEDYAIFNDWGYYPIGSDTPGTWRTLTREEWGYLLWKRPSAANLKGYATVGEVRGYFLLPDMWMDVEDIPIVKGFFSGNTITEDLLNQCNQWTTAQWKVLEEQGAIFLPVEGDFYSSLNVWTASSEISGAGEISVTINFYPTLFGYSTLLWGYQTSVRLIRDVKP